MGNEDAVSCMKALDVNDSGHVDSSDSVHLYRFLFSRGAPPAAPFPTCGTDPTNDGISCKARCD